ncbi:MAG TPA: ABC transporter ATP-binding protein [Marmoricola sp.]
MTRSRRPPRGGHRGRTHRLVWRLGAEVRPYWRSAVAIFVVDLVAIPLVLLTPVPLKIAVDNVLGGKPLPGPLDAVLPDALTVGQLRLLVVAAVMQVLVVVLAELQQVASYVLRVRSGELMTQGLRERMFGHAQRLSLLRHDSRGSSDSVYRIQYDAAELQKVTVDGLLTAATAAITLVTTVVVVCRLDWTLAAVGLTVSPLLVLLTRRYRQRVRPRYRDVKGIETDAMQVVHEALGALRVVKAFGQEDGERDRFSVRSGIGVRARIRLAGAEGTFGLLVNLVTAVGTATVLFIGVLHVQRGVLTLGELLMVIAYLSQLYSPLKTISKRAAILQSSLASAERVFEFLDEPVDVPEARHPVPLVRARGLVEFEHVEMSYGNGSPTLRDITFRVEPHQQVGISGMTGAGKTTLVSLLVRFFDPVAGRVLLDGVDLRDYRVADLRRQVSVVLQEPVLFSSSVAENIRYARPDADLAEVMAAAELADAHGFIQALPSRYDTLVGERGVRLSGGERQRISLARAFLKDAPVLVLDEPTSSVDVVTEGRILDAMERLRAGRTSFLIAHRASTLQHCDFCLELSHGRLVGRRMPAPLVPGQLEGSW